MREEFVGTLGVLLAVTIGIVAHLALTPYGIATSPDSISYFDAASHIRNGDGYVQTNYALDESTSTVPQTTWPPLYPAAVAVARSFASTTPAAASYVNIAVLVLTVLALHALLRDTAGPAVGALAAVGLVLAKPTLTAFSYAWSEPLFVACLLVSLYLIQRSQIFAAEDRAGWHFVSVILLAVTLAGLFYTRYVGFLFAPLLPLCWLLLSRKRRFLLHYVAAGSVYAAACAALLFRNQMLAGDVRGLDIGNSVRSDSQLSVFDNSRDLLNALGSSLPASPVAWIVALLAAAAVVAALRNRSAVSASRQGPHHFLLTRTLGIATAVSALAYAGGLILLRTLTSFDRIDIRYVSVLLPLLVIGLALALTWRRDRADRLTPQALVALLSAVLLLGFGIKGVEAYNSALANLRDHGVPKFDARGDFHYVSYTVDPDRSTNRRFVRSLLAERDGMIIADRPDILLYLGGLPLGRDRARAFPDGRLSEEILGDLNTVGAGGWLVLENDSDAAARLREYYGENFDKVPFVERYKPSGALVTGVPLPDR
jgi:hypothetical protein